MKKLKLNALAFTNAEVLSRAQLKKVMGGNGSGGSGSGYTCYGAHQLADGSWEFPTIGVDDEADANDWCADWMQPGPEQSLFCNFSCFQN